MKLSIDHHDKTFNINFHRAEGEDAFLSIKGCRIASGSKGPFLSLPASKNGEKWWNHVWADEKFQSAVMQLAGKAAPKPAPRPAPRAAPAQGSGFEDMDSDVPF